MPSAAFLEAASAANRKPVILLAVESEDAIRRESSTQADWNAAKASLNINTAAPNDIGNVMLVTDGAEPYSGTYTITLTHNGYVNANGYPSPWATSAAGASNDRTVSVLASGRLHHIGSYMKHPEYGYHSTLYTLWLQASTDGGANWSDVASYEVPTYTDGQHHDFTITGAVAKGAACITRLRIAQNDRVPEDPNVWYENDLEIWFEGVVYSYETLYLSSGYLRTISLDLGLIPSTDSVFQADDIVSSGCSLTYTVRGSNDGATWLELGSVVDGSTVHPYRYYDILAGFESAEGWVTPMLREVAMVGGNSQYDYFSTHKDEPVKGALPYIKEGGISSLTTKIDLLKPSTTGEVTAKLFWREATGDMLATGYLKNKNVICCLGFVGLAARDYEPYFTGTWYDYTADSRSSTVDIKTRDVWKKFKRSIPEETVDASGNKTTAPLVLSGNIIQVILDIVDLVGAPDRLIDRDTLVTLRDTVYTGADWNVSRTITEPQDADELINELAVSAGLFIYVGSDGRMTAVSYDAAVDAPLDPAETLDATRVEFEAIDGGQGELKTRHRVHYQLIAGKNGGAKEDYLKEYISINAASETAWRESQEVDWFDRWGLSPVVVQKLAQRLDFWFSNPKSRVKAKKVPTRYMGITTGSVIPVDNLEVPATAANWQAGLRYTSQKKFLVMSRTVDPKDLTLSFELFEVGPTSYQLQDLPSYPAYELFPPVRGLKLSERISRRRDRTIDTLLDVEFDQPADFHFGRAEIWFRKGTNGWAYAGAVDYGGPNTHSIFTMAVQDLYTYRVAVITVNAAGLRQDIDLSPQETRFIFGKTLKPADVAEVWAQASSGALKLSWSQVADPDVFDYIVKYRAVESGAAWQNSLFVDRVAGTSLTLPAAKDGLYLVKAVDTSGNESVNYTAVWTTVPSFVKHNAQATLTEHSAFSGTKANVSVVSGDLILDTNGDFDAIADLDALEDLDGLGDVYEVGYYESATVVDLGSVQTARCSVDARFYPVDMENLFDDIVDFDAITNLDGEVDGVAVQGQVALSQDGSTFGAWQNFLVADMTARKFKFRLRLSSTMPRKYPAVEHLVFNVDMPDRSEEGTASLPAGGSTISFSTQFVVAPKVFPTALSLAPGEYVYLTNVTATGFTVQVKDGSGSGVAKTINWQAKGY